MKELSEERAYIREAFAKVYKKAETIADFVLPCYFIIGLCIAPIYNTWGIAVFSGGSMLLCYYLVKWKFAKTLLHQYILSAIFGFFTVQYIYQLHGLVEVRLMIFVGGVILMYFERYRLLIPMGIIVAVHHNLAAYFEYTGNNVFFYSEHEHFSLTGFLLMFSITGLVIFLFGKISHDNARRTKGVALSEYKLHTQLKNVKSNVAFAEQLAKGDLSSSYELEENDTLGESLISLRDNLKSAKEREEEEKFFNVGLAKASEILRVQNNDLNTLAVEIITFLVKYLKGIQGALFILQDEDSNNIYLEMASCYAFDRRKYLKKKVEIGEGLVGQAFLEKDFVYLKDVPVDYVTITSGLGEAPPRSILVVPLMLNDKVYGVIEIASFQLMEKHKTDFLKKVGETIASTLSTTKINRKTQLLLQESQELAERLRAQEEEMRQNMEELQASQEEMARSQRELEKRQGQELQ